MGGGLINDPAAAARNRQNIEIMRLREKAHPCRGRTENRAVTTETTE
jgi:hypothetical protein